MTGSPSAAPPAPRWRALLKPRWLGWHLFALLSVAGMLALGYWQLRRAEAGNSLSWAYTFEWPIFAVFAVVFWIKTIRDELNPPAGHAAAPPELPVSSGALSAGNAVGSGAAGSPQAAAPGAGDGEEEEDDEELAAYNAYLARLHDEVKGHGKWHGLR
jgi:hypothetical protein